MEVATASGDFLPAKGEPGYVGIDVSTNCHDDARIPRLHRSRRRSPSSPSILHATIRRVRPTGLLLRNPYDAFAQNSMADICRQAGEVQKELKIRAPVRFADLWYVPDPDKRNALERFGVLRRMTEEGPCLFEFFHEAPSLEEVRKCEHKLLTLLTRDAGDTEPWLWIISAGRPDTVVEAYSLRELESWPRGFYGDVQQRRLRFVIVKELPSVRETLVLRLYGAGKVLEKALRELADLPPDAPEKSVFGPHVIELTQSLQNEPAHLPIEKEITMVAEGFGERWKREILAEGIEQGIEKGIEKGIEQATREVLARLLSFRFGPLDADAQARIDRASKADLDDWLERFVYASSLRDILRL